LQQFVINPVRTLFACWPNVTEYFDLQPSVQEVKTQQRKIKKIKRFSTQEFDNLRVLLPIEAASFIYLAQGYLFLKRWDMKTSNLLH
jgi:hypothetical protein